MSQSKIKFLIHELATNLQLNESTEGNIDLVSRNLILTNAEFKRIPKAKFKEMVETTLAEVIKDRAQEIAVSNAVVERKVTPATPKKNLGIGTHSDTNGPTSNSSSSSSSITQKNLTSGVKRKRGTGLKDKSDFSQQPDDFQHTLSSTLPVGDTRPTVRLKDLAGLNSTLQSVKELVFYPVQLPTLYKQLGIQPPSGLLLHGPSGCGKTTLAMAIGGELNLPFFKVSGPELIGGTSGESETRIRELFDNAIRHSPSIIFIDAIDVIAGKREGSQRGMDRRVVAQLFDCIDDIKNLGKISSISGTGVDRKECANTHLSNRNSNSNCGSDPSGDLSGEAKNTERQTPISEKQEQEHSVAGSYSHAHPDGGDLATPSRKHVIFIAATDKPDSLDPGVRGRFSKELALPVPDAKARTLILQLATGQMKVDTDVDFESLGKSTPGFVGADLHALCSEAGVIAVKRIVSSFPTNADGQMSPEMIEESIQQKEVLNGNNTCKKVMVTTNTKEREEEEAIGNEMEIEVDLSVSSSLIPNEHHKEDVVKINNDRVADNFNVTMADFLLATKNIQPSAKREGFAVVPDVTWNDVGALSSVREELLHNVIEPISHPDRFIQLGLEVPAGVLFFGPPGCGKTLLAKALSNQSGANFISVKGPELLNMYVGESESRVRQVFTRARASAPCVIFFDELDALCPRRGMGADGGSGVSERVVNQLLTELDGLESRKDVYVIAATNRLELIDDAMLRPGRLGKLLYVPLPSAVDRGSILKAVSRKISIGPEVDLDAIGSDPRADGFSGADLAALVREAGMGVMQDWRSNQFRDGANTSAGGDAEDSACTGAKTSFNISTKHFDHAFGKVRASVNFEDRQRYDRVHELINVEGLGAIEALRKAREEFD